MRAVERAPARGTAGVSPFLLWLIWLFWLFFLVQPLSQSLALPPSPLKAISLGGLALFIALYLIATWQNAWRLSRETPEDAPEPRWLAWGPVAALTILAVVMTLMAGETALGSMIYVSAALCGRLSGRQVIFAVAGLTALVASLGYAIHASPEAVAQFLFITPAVGSIVYFLDQAIRQNQELRRARQEIARLAVSEERLRFARDLHDLLGHTLSLIALKSELAGRLVSVAPERAATEIGDIETAARQALVEVREAVAAYRQPSLASELSAARELLAAADIAFSQRGAAPPLSPAAEAALAWVVREGVTNVIRHSSARACAISFLCEGGALVVELRDDGAVQPPDADGTLAGGSGLAGARERITALGGSFTASAAADGGWRLAVSLPLAGATSTPEESEAMA
ncbi:MAG TPA: sensor histidine kinase [Ktedonobacterales bacterium]